MEWISLFMDLILIKHKMLQIIYFLLLALYYFYSHPPPPRPGIFLYIWFKPPYSPTIFSASQHSQDNTTPSYSPHSCGLVFISGSTMTSCMWFTSPQMVFHSSLRKARCSLFSQTKHILAPNMANAFPSVCQSQIYYHCKSEGTLLLPVSFLSLDKYQNDTDLLLKSSLLCLRFLKMVWVVFSVIPLLVII